MHKIQRLKLFRNRDGFSICFIHDFFFFNLCCPWSQFSFSLFNSFMADIVIVTLIIPIQFLNPGKRKKRPSLSCVVLRWKRKKKSCKYDGTNVDDYCHSFKMFLKRKISMFHLTFTPIPQIRTYLVSRIIYGQET